MNSPAGSTVLIESCQYDYFCGSGYFTLQCHPALIKSLSEAAHQYGISAATSRAGYGNNPIFQAVEQKAAQFFGSESALYTVSGYLGNAILLKGLSDQYDIIFSDAQSHYAIQDGAAMANKPLVSFAHCDAKDLQAKLNAHLKPGQTPLLITDGIFPASGVIAPLADYHTVLSHYENPLMCVDDAHAFGVIGEKGQGSLEYHQLQHPNYYASGTLSKAFGGHGGIICGSHDFIEQLKANTHFLYGASAVPIPIAAASAAGLDRLIEQPQLRQQLWKNALYAKQALRDIGFTDIPDTPVPIICLSAPGADLGAIQSTLFDQGIAVHHVPGGSYTSVPRSGAIRIAIFSSHTQDQIDRLVSAIDKANIFSA